MNGLEYVKGKNFMFSVLTLGIASASFGLGRLSVVQENNIPIQVVETEEVITRGIHEGQHAEELEIVEGVANVSQSLPAALSVKVQKVQVGTLSTGGGVIGVKTSKKYYYPWCHPVPRLKETNAVPFSSIEEARAAGYVPSKNCKGLK